MVDINYSHKYTRYSNYLFFPKSCGSTRSTGSGSIHITDCKCLGFLRDSPPDKFTPDTSFNVCYGICSDCVSKKTEPVSNNTNRYDPKNLNCHELEVEVNILVVQAGAICESDSDCVVSTEFVQPAYDHNNCQIYSIFNKDDIKRVKPKYHELLEELDKKGCILNECESPIFPAPPTKEETKCIDGLCQDTRHYEYCNKTYTKIDNELQEANYCKIDSDCKVIPIGGGYIEFGCYHYVNKEINETIFYDKMFEYDQMCNTMIDDCAPAPPVKCVNNKCV